MKRRCTFSSIDALGYLHSGPQGAEAGFRGHSQHSIDQEEGGFLFQVDGLRRRVDQLETKEHQGKFLLNLTCFAACIEGLFFFAAFAYVYFLRSKGLLHGLASGTNWVFRDESCHMQFAFSVIETVRQEEPELFDDKFKIGRC